MQSNRHKKKKSLGEKRVLCGGRLIPTTIVYISLFQVVQLIFKFVVVVVVHLSVHVHFNLGLSPRDS